MSINRVFLSGNLTRDPELKSTSGGTSVLTFGIAVNERRKNGQTGQWEDRPNFFDCSMYGTRAEAVSRLLSKGMKASIEGRLQWRQWQDSQSGQNRSKVDVVVNEIEFMEPRQAAQPPAQPVAQPMPAQPVQAPQTAPQPVQQPIPVQADYYDYDVPFGS